jgi:hypothetical protein
MYFPDISVFISFLLMLLKISSFFPQHTLQAFLLSFYTLVIFLKIERVCVRVYAGIDPSTFQTYAVPMKFTPSVP